MPLLKTSKTGAVFHVLPNSDETKKTVQMQILKEIGFFGLNPEKRRLFVDFRQNLRRVTAAKTVSARLFKPRLTMATLWTRFEAFRGRPKPYNM